MFYGEIRKRTWGIEFTGIASCLKVFQQRFVHIAKLMALSTIKQVNGIYLVYHLTQ